ncbi:hypothetical protein P9112_010583 [Eukaryota sp. TZLM1-RC]
MKINMSRKKLLPISLIDIPYNIKELYCGGCCSFALTKEDGVVKWGHGKSFEFIKELSNIVALAPHYDVGAVVDGDSFLATEETGDIFLFHITYDLRSPFKDLEYYTIGIDDEYPNHLSSTTKLSVTQHLDPRKSVQGSFFFEKDKDKNQLFVIDFKGFVWKCEIEIDQNELINTNPTKVFGLSRIATICGYRGVYSAIDNNGKVFVWGQLNAISESYEFLYHPICIETFTNIEAISLGNNFIFAYNKNTVWAWGRNDKSQLGTGVLIDRPHFMKVFGSEILGRFLYPKQPLDRMFSGLIKLVYWEYLNYLDELFGNHPYVKARFYTKCGISKRVVQFAQEVFNDHPIQNKMCIQDPENLELDENICELQLRLSNTYIGPNVIYNRIKKLDIYYENIADESRLFFLFPSVEVVQLRGIVYSDRNPRNLTHLSNLKCLELHCEFCIGQLPTSLVKLVLKHKDIGVADLSYFTSLKELVVMPRTLSERILKGRVSLPYSIIKLEIDVGPVDIQIQLPNLKELIIHSHLPTNITEQNFPSLKFIQLISPDMDILSKSYLSPSLLINQGLIESVKQNQKTCIVELSCFPWWIQYPVKLVSQLGHISSLHLD